MSRYKLEEGKLIKIEEWGSVDNRKKTVFNNFLKELHKFEIKFELPMWKPENILDMFLEKRPTLHIKMWKNNDLRAFDFDFDLKLITSSFMKEKPNNETYQNVYEMERLISELWLKCGGVLD